LIGSSLGYFKETLIYWANTLIARNNTFPQRFNNKFNVGIGFLDALTEN